LSDHQINAFGAKVIDLMGFNIMRLILFLVVASAFATLPCMGGGCGASCAVSGGSSYNFMGDRAFSIGMSSFDEFVRDNVGQTSLSTKSLSSDDPLIANSSMNQTSNASLTDVDVLPAINSRNMTSDTGTVKLGASGAQDTRLSTLVFTTFDNKSNGLGPMLYGFEPFFSLGDARTTWHTLS
jgi:hypothetical protein